MTRTCLIILSLLSALTQLSSGGHALVRSDTKAVIEPKVSHHSEFPATMMPQVTDYTSMSWAEGFPSVVTDAKWIRRIRTGTYEFDLNTETLSIPHLGPVHRAMSYEKLIEGEERTKNSPAELDLILRVNNKEYHCHQAEKWSRFTGPRVIESGRFVQRADVTDLVFRSADGEILNAEARFETIAWPDRLGFILVVRPGSEKNEGGKAAVTSGVNLPAPAVDNESRAVWNDVSLAIVLKNSRVTLKQENLKSTTEAGEHKGWYQVALSFNPLTMKKAAASSMVIVKARELKTGTARKVEYQSSLGWHRVDLDGVRSLVPAVGQHSLNDAAERIRIQLTNPSETPQMSRLMFAKTPSGFRHRIGSAITGVSMTLRDTLGNPIGIPVQLSKNWHGDKRGGVYAKTWLHGITQLRLPAKSEFELELMITYGHWGGVAAASHAQLSLIGWGSNQLWEQSALGAWGEAICYEPSQAQANCTITDVRPLMLSNPGEKNHWKWTVNVGGGDFFRMFDPSGMRVGHSAMQAIRHRQGPCLTEVSYSGKVSNGVRHSSTVSIARTDDLVRGFYRIRLKVDVATDFSRLVLFQVGADTYNFTGEKKLAMGNSSGVIKQWDAQWGGDKYQTEPLKCLGESPWVSMHQAQRPWTRVDSPWANRGIIIRSWRARLGGEIAAPWIAEHGSQQRGKKYSTIDIVPPPGITRLEVGDYVEAVVEHIIIPQDSKDYYGPNQELRTALEVNADTWKMVHREASKNNPNLVMKQGGLVRKFPDVRIRTENGCAEFEISGGLGYIPLTFLGLPSHDSGCLVIDGKPLDQSVHGNDFWQCDYDPMTQLWSRTYNIPANADLTKNS
ncbi:MAG: hypothetical protein ABGY95_09480, partial [Rubritalea sp.]|uniref:hypothetical protein n=1 Tax=Rubritalea sp. TaxID=2109375 RepID=UPI003241BFA8